MDDGLIIGDDEAEINGLLRKLGKEFEMTVTSNPKIFVGTEINKTNEGLKLTQSDYTNKILKRFKMEESKLVATPAVKENNTTEECLNNSYPFKEAIGSLLYLSCKTKPDLNYAINIQSRHTENPNNKNLIAVKRIFRYINGTKSKGIHFKSQENEELTAFCDSDFAGDEDTRRSHTGFVIFYNGGPISWCSRKQNVVALSSTEAEYIAASECCKEVLYLKTLLEEITQKHLKSTIYIDNQSAISLIKNGVTNKRSKRIDVRYHFIHDAVKGDINIEYCPTNLQIVDLFTKPLERVKFEQLRNDLVK